MLLTYCYNLIVQTKSKKRIGILRGGTGHHYKSSLEDGADMFSCIFENLADKYKPVDILVDKDYIWHINGLPVSPSDLIHKVDIVWNTSHPSLSNILDSLSIPNVGISSFSYTLGINRDILKRHMDQVGVQIPRHIVLPVYQPDFDGPRERYAIKKAKEVHEKFTPPWIVKSFTPDANMAVHLAHTFNELVAGIEDGVNHEKSILVEEFISGKVASVHSVPDFRGEEIYIFPPVNVFGNLSLGEREKLTILTKDLHKHVGAKHYLKSSFLVNKRGKVYLLDFESTPNLKSYSHFSQACEQVGAKVHQIVEHILEKVSV